VSDRASDPRPAWRDLFDEPALRRLARLASLRGGEELVWVGAGGEKLAKQLEKICEEKVKVRPDLEGIPKRSLGLIVAPEIVEQMGLEQALKQLRGALETDGVLALAMRAAVGDDVPAEARAFWEQRQHGPLDSVMQVLGRFSAIGLEALTVELAPLAPEDEEPGEETRGPVAPAPSPVAPASSPESSPILRGVGLGLFIGRRLEAGSPPRWPRRAGME